MRVIIKLSGEVLQGNNKQGFCPNAIQDIVKRLKELRRESHEIGIVLGGGNFFRGEHQELSLNLSRVSADNIGMLCTLVNGIALQEALINGEVPVRVLSAMECPKVVESYQYRNALAYFKAGDIVLFVGGTGHPYFTTDTNAALRACEMKADLLVKATTKVDYVFDKDPLKHIDAVHYTSISFQDVLDRKLGIMDLSAITLCMKSNIPIRVCNFNKVSLPDAISCRGVGTTIGVTRE